MGDEGLLTDTQSMENAGTSADTTGTSLQVAVQNAINSAVNSGAKSVDFDLSPYTNGMDVMVMRASLSQNNYRLNQNGSVLTIKW